MEKALLSVAGIMVYSIDMPHKTNASRDVVCVCHHITPLFYSGMIVIQHVQVSCLCFFSLCRGTSSVVTSYVRQ